LSAPAAEHDLLVGALALQLDFVTREQLVALAVEPSQWSGRTLIERLQAQGALSRQEVELLEALVVRHLARHDDDATKSLASCPAAPELRDLLTRIENQIHASAPLTRDPLATAPPNLGGSRASTANDSLAASPHAPTIAAPPGGAPPAPAARGTAPLSQPAAQRFRIVRAFSRGGLGQVSLARDQELNRDVALKEILPKHADNPEARQRFLVEAEITGSLEHPGVVPVYGLGQYADGRPFYAMRFIRGDDLQRAIDDFHQHPRAPDRELRFHQLLGRFVDVCNAIEYAHNRCVLHRDLKPGNIMLGKYGETLVVDWGLAKAIGPLAASTDAAEQPVRPVAAEESTATQLGRIVGTPAYMSPEQAMGRIDQLGPATDIYSLGATLYQLLTGSAPFAFAASDSLLDDVRMGLFPAPRSIRADVPRALEAICLKAMARQAGDRYASARELADDVERYLADEPVHAYAEPTLARLWRWMRRHRAAVLGAAAVLTVTAIALAVGVILLDAANRREQRLRQRADDQWQRAESNFEMAREAVRDYYVTVSEDTLLDQPGMQPLRGLLLRQALSYYQTFLERGEAEGALRDEIAQANYFAGRITETLDAPAKALPYYERANALNAELVQETPADLSRLYELGRTLNALGGVLQKLQRWDRSKSYYQQAEAARQRLLDARPDNVEYVRTLANTIMNLGSVDDALGDPQAAVDRWKRAQQLREDRLSAGETDVRLQADAGKGYFNLGAFSFAQEDDAAAEQYLNQAVAAFERVRTAAPDDLNSQMMLASAHRTLADLFAANDRLDESRRHYEQAVELLATLALRNPQVPDYRAALASVETVVAQSWLNEGRPDEALDPLQKAIDAFEPLVEEYPDQLLYQHDLAAALRLRGQARLIKSDRPAAVADFRRAVDILDRLVSAHPEDADYKSMLEEAKQALAEADR